MFLATLAPPLDRVANPTTQWIVLALAGTAFICATAVALREWRRRGTPLLLLALVGGAIATLMEPMYDLVTRLYMYEKGAYLLFTIGGRGIQLWAPLGYGVYIGICVYVFYRLALDEQTTRRAYWWAVGVIMVLNLLIELPATRMGLYEYYGPQAFNITGFPLYWLLSNIAGSMAAGILFAKLPSLIEGPRILSVVLLVPSCFVAGEVFIQWPAFAAVGMDGSGYLLTYTGALISIGIGVFVLRFMANLISPRVASDLASRETAMRR